MTTASGEAAAEIRRSIDRIADVIADRHMARHPELVQRYGAAGRIRCIEDTRFHLEFLAAALDAESPYLFLDYVSWARIVLLSRRIPTDDLGGNLQQMAEALATRLHGESFDRVRDVIEHAIRELPSMPDSVPSFLDSSAPNFSLAESYLRALLEGNARAAAAIAATAVARGLTLRDLYRTVIEPVQREVGRLWQINRITVAQEHYCTAATQQIMSQLYNRAFGSDRRRRRMVAACAGGEQHELGLRVITDLLELDGWNVDYLGANVPPQSVVDLCVERKAEVLLVSATLPPHVVSVADLIRRFREAPQLSSAKVVVGGRAFEGDENLWRRIGADGYGADADQCVDLIRQLAS